MKNIFITGGATGIGRASVEKFIQQGWNVAFMDINIEEGANLAGMYDSGHIIFVQGDARSRQDCMDAVGAAVAKFGGIDSVFVNAGIHRSNTLLDITDEELHCIIDTNIYGSINTLQAAVPAIIKRGGGTVVINCSDQWFVGKPHSFAYGLTKGALGQITRSLSIDLAPDNVRVNAVCAGTIRTPLFDEALARTAQKKGIDLQKLYREENAMYPRGSVGEPGEVANLVYFLASDESSFCTGGHYLVDGGLVAR